MDTLIVRDYNGVYLGSGQAIGKHTTHALEGELQALIIAMQHCWSRGYRRVCFEGDNKVMMELLTGSQRNFGVHNWICEVQRWREKFDDCIFQWTRRTSNGVADTLAKAPFPTNVSFIYHFYAPPVITNTLHCDYLFQS